MESIETPNLLTIKKAIQNIDAVILVGGKNRRFQGKQKSLAKLKGQPLIEHQLSILEDIFQNIFLVSNSKEEFSKYCHLNIIPDLFKNKGPLGGIHSGMVHSESRYVFVFAGDMPFLNKDLIKKQIELVHGNSYDAIVPHTRKGIEPLHGIYDTKTLKKIETILNKSGIYSVRELFDVIQTYYWNIPEQKAFVNINTQEELKHYENS